jgi:hypothetical protein
MVPNLKCIATKVANKVKLIAFCSRADALSGKTFDDQTTVSSIISNPMEEHAKYKASSVDGNCAAPVVSENGHCVGWHNATAPGYTVFIPVTSIVSQKATGKADFQ